MELSALVPSPFCDRQDSVIPSHPAGEHRRILPILAGKEKENRGKQCQRPGDPTLSISSAKANSCLGHALVRAASNPRELPLEAGMAGQGLCHGFSPKALGSLVAPSQGAPGQSGTAPARLCSQSCCSQAQPGGFSALAGPGEGSQPPDERSGNS